MTQRQQKQKKNMNRFIKFLGKYSMNSSFVKLVRSSLEKKKLFIERQKRISYYNTTKRSLNSKSWLGKRKISQSQQQRKGKMIIDRVSQNKNQIQDNKNITINSFKLTDKQLGNSIRLFQNKDKKKSISQIQTLSKALQKSNIGLKSTTNRITVHNREKSMLKSHYTKKNSIQQFLKKRSELIKTNHMDIILIKLTGNPNINKLRIYKDRMKKFYNFRYIKQKITTFFQYQYIEDVTTQINYLQSLLSLTLHEIYFLCFITLDINSDALLCNDDLFAMATILPENPLINKDVYRIFEHVNKKMYSFQQMDMEDQAAQDDPAKDININLQRYRFLMMREQKDEKNKTQSADFNSKQSIRKDFIKTVNRVKTSTDSNHKPIVMSRRVGRHLFSLSKEEQQGQVAIKELRKKIAIESSFPSNNNRYKFKINFQRYLTIFKGIIPQTYFDILFLQGGIQLQGKKYCPLNYDIDQIEKKVQFKIQTPKLTKYHQQLNIMRRTVRQNKVESLKSRYSLYQSLQNDFQ